MTNKFGFWTLAFLVIANMIGAGVFTTSGYSLAALGSASVVMAAWLVGGLIALAGAVSYGMLIRKMPESGGEYLFLSRAVHPLFGFIAGWVSLIAGFSGAIAFAAVALEGYIVPTESDGQPFPPGSIAITSIIVSGLFHGVRPRLGAAAQNLVVVLKLVLLASVLLFAASRTSDDWQGWPAESSPLTGWALIAAFAGSLVWISLSYSGFNAAVYVAGEVENPGRTVPRALFAGTAIVFVLYLLLNATFVYAPPPNDVRGKADVAAIAAQFLGGDRFETFVRATIGLCLLTSVFSMMMAAPRVYAKMADDGLLPALLKFSGDSPRGAVATQVVIAIGLVMLTDLQGLLSYLGLTLSLSAACSAACLFLPKVRTRSLFSPIHAIPAFYVVCTLVAAAVMTYDNPWQLLGTALTFLVGIAAYVNVRSFARVTDDVSR